MNEDSVYSLWCQGTELAALQLVSFSLTEEGLSVGSVIATKKQAAS